MEIKRNIHLNRIISTIAMLLCICWMPVSAQIRIVDEQDGKPVAGAYIFSSDNHLLCISDSKGNIEPQSGIITISNVAYESKTIDASTIKGDVLLKQKVYALPEVTANKTDYIKLTGVFRDICRNNGKTILYREGIMDFYINLENGKTKRRVRACRQYERSGLRKLINFNISILSEARSFDMSRIKYVKRDTINSIKGDTTFYSSHFKGTQSDKALMYIDTHQKNLYRHIIDNTQYRKITNPLLKIKTDVCDWTFSDKKEAWSSLVSFRKIWNYDNTPLPGKSAIETEEMNDFVVTGVKALTKEQAQTEMKDRTETDNFTLPDCLPAIPYDVAKETEGLLIKRFWEM